MEDSDSQPLITTALLCDNAARMLKKKCFSASGSGGPPYWLAKECGMLVSNNAGVENADGDAAMNFTRAQS
jgi:hypothetical protein